MAIDSADVLELIKIRLGFTDVSLDALLNSYIPEMEQRILNYCNVDAVPDGLKFVWASMVIDVLKVEQSTLPQVQTALGNSVEVTVGDTTTKTKPGSAPSKSVIDAVVLNYRVDLNRYRELRW